MKNEYDLKKRKKRPGKVDPEAARIAISLKVDGGVIADFKDEALRTGIPYQTLMNSVLYRFVRGELVDRKEIDHLSNILRQA